MVELHQENCRTFTWDRNIVVPLPISSQKTGQFQPKSKSIPATQELVPPVNTMPSQSMGAGASYLIFKFEPVSYTPKRMREAKWSEYTGPKKGTNTGLGRAAVTITRSLVELSAPGLDT
jgi:hypothetical protein